MLRQCCSLTRLKLAVLDSHLVTKTTLTYISTKRTINLVVYISPSKQYLYEIIIYTPPHPNTHICAHQSGPACQL